MSQLKTMLDHMHRKRDAALENMRAQRDHWQAQLSGCSTGAGHGGLALALAENHRPSNARRA
jgi:hypothetical protein